MSRILLVDDDEAVRYALGKYLRRAGHEVVEAADGRAAAGILATAVFDLVITDIIMPDADGIEVIMMLLRREPRIPVIAISGGGRIGQAEYLELASGLGASAVLPKPLDPEQLLQLVSQLAGGCQ